MPGSRLNVHLYRDSFNTPWGFRLQGGKDLNQPLTVQRVFSNSPAEGELQRGDVILSINNRDSAQLTHKQAQDFIKHCGGQVQLVVNRPPPGTHIAPLSPPIVTHPPRAPSLQPLSWYGALQEKFKIALQDESTPVAADYVKGKLKRLRLVAAHYGGRPYNQIQSSGDLYDGPQETEPDRLATGPIPKVCSLRNLGGGGSQFGTTFGSGSGSATLPRRSTGRRLSQPARMPGNTGYNQKVPVKLGGGGASFGSDFNRGYGQTPAQRYEPHHSSSDMLNRVQTSLDNITLSPRTPEVQTSSPFYQPYQPYEPPAPTPSTQIYQAQPPPQQMYTPTALLLEQQRLQEQQDEAPPSGNRPLKVFKPKTGPSSYSSFGVDYNQSQQRPGTWRPAPQFKPTPAPASAAPSASYSPMAVQYSPRPGPSPVAPKPSPPGPSEIVHATPPPWQRQEEADTGTPAWRSTLKSTGVKPWERDLEFSQQEEPVRSVPFNPAPAKSPVQAGPFSPTGAVDDGTNGPKVVHLQYNSPLHLYSNENVAETLQGQTQALTGQTNKPPPPKTNESGDRDWSQSAVLRFINQQDSRKSKPAPPVAPKPQLSPQPPAHPPQQQFQPFYDEVGASDF